MGAQAAPAAGFGSGNRALGVRGADPVAADLDCSVPPMAMPTITTTAVAAAASVGAVRAAVGARSGAGGFSSSDAFSVESGMHVLFNTDNNKKN